MRLVRNILRLVGNTEDVARAVMLASVNRFDLSFNKMSPLNPEAGDTPLTKWGVLADLDHHDVRSQDSEFDDDEGLGLIDCALFEFNTLGGAALQPISAWSKKCPNVTFGLKWVVEKNAELGLGVFRGGEELRMEVTRDENAPLFNAEQYKRPDPARDNPIVDAIFDGAYRADMPFDIHAPNPGGSWTPLHWAAYVGDIHAVKQLIEKGADIAAKDSAGFYPLDVACHFVWFGMPGIGDSGSSLGDIETARAELAEALSGPAVTSLAPIYHGDLDRLFQHEARTPEMVHAALLMCGSWKRVRPTAEWLHNFIPQVREEFFEGLNAQVSGRYIFETLMYAIDGGKLVDVMREQGADYSLLENPYQIYHNAKMAWGVDADGNSDNLMGLARSGVDPAGKVSHLLEQYQEVVIGLYRAFKLESRLCKVTGEAIPRRDRARLTF